MAGLSRNISNKSGVMAKRKKIPGPLSKYFFYQEIQDLAPLSQNTKNKSLAERGNLLQKVCLLCLPRQQQNRLLTHLCHATPPPPPSFSIQTGNRRKCRNDSDQVRLDDGKQRKGDVRGTFTPLLGLITALKTSQLRVTHSS